MSFRERTAWITLVSLVTCFGGYYGATLSGLVAPTSFAAFHLGIASIVLVVILQIGLTLAAALMNPTDAGAPRDERERAIHARSHVIGYYVLMPGMGATLVATHLRFAGERDLDAIVRTVNIGLLAMVASALAVAIAQIVMYRRGS